MKVKVTVHSMYNISVNTPFYYDVEPEDLDENGELTNVVHNELWQEAVNDFCSDSSIELVEDDDE